MGSVIFVPWFIANYPGSAILSCSNTDRLVKGFSKKVRRLIEQHSNVLGVDFLKGSEANDEWETTNGCQYTVLGVGSANQGRRADLVIIDDPFPSAEDAQSKTYRDQVYTWFKDDILPRSKPGARIVIINTRFHEDDLSGRLLSDNAAAWNLLSLQAVAEGDDPLGRLPGELLWPEYQDQAFYDELELSGTTWNALYQQRPSDPDGSIFKVEQISVLPAAPASTQIVRAWDLAATKQVGSRDPDWTVGLKLALHPDGRLTVLDVVRFRGDPQDVEAAILNTAAQDGRSVRIGLPQDPGGAGKTQARYLVSKLQGYSVEVSTETGSKETRAMPIASQANVGNLQILQAHWNRLFLEELAAFPTGKKDDQVDALSRAASMLIEVAKPARFAYRRWVR